MAENFDSNVDSLQKAGQITEGQALKLKQQRQVNEAESVLNARDVVVKNEQIMEQGQAEELAAQQGTEGLDQGLPTPEAAPIPTEQVQTAEGQTPAFGLGPGERGEVAPQVGTDQLAAQDQLQIEEAAAQPIASDFVQPKAQRDIQAPGREAVATTRAGFESQKAAQEQLTKLSGLRARTEEALANEERILRQRIAGQILKKQEAQNDFINKKIAEFGAAQQAFEAMPTGQRTDIMDQFPFGRKLFSFISFATAASGGPNKAADKFNKSLAKESMKNKKDFIQLLQLGFKNNKDITAAYDSIMTNEFKLRAKEFGEKIKNQEVKARLDETIGKLDVEQEKRMLEIQKAARVEAEQRVELVGRRVEDIDPRTLSKAERDLWVPGSGFAKNKQQADSLIKVKNENQPAIRATERIMEIITTDPLVLARFNPIKRAAMNTELIALVGNLRVPFTGPGVLQQAEFERLKNAIGNPVSLFSLPPIEKAKIRMVQQILQTKIDVAEENAGIPKAKIKSFQRTK